MMIKNTKGINTHLRLGAATAFFVFCIFPGLRTFAVALPEIGKFSTATAGGDFPAGWEPLNFKKIPRHTQYIWSSNAPRGTIVSNPYTKRVKMIAVQSGKTRLNTWVQEKRNVFEDYKTAFSQAPPHDRCSHDNDGFR